MKISSILLASLLLAGCATGGGGPGLFGSNQTNGPKRSSNAPQDLLPYIDVSDVAWLETSSSNDYDDRYTRIFAVLDRCIVPGVNPEEYCEKDSTTERSDEAPEPQNDAGEDKEDNAGNETNVTTVKPKRNYDDEDRNWFRRWLIGKTVSQAFLITFNLNESEFQITKELFSLSWDSNNLQGEAWATSQTVDRIISPYFKVDANTRLGMSVELNLSENSTSEVSANVVTALSKAAGLIAPSSSLLTDLSSEKVTEASKFLDDSVSALFDKSITETLEKDIPVELYKRIPGQTCGHIATVHLDLPHVGDIRDVDNSISGVGVWNIYLERPISSVFVKQNRQTGCNPHRLIDSNTDGKELKVYDNLNDVPEGTNLIYDKNPDRDDNGRLKVEEPDFSRLQLGDVLDFKVATDLTVYDFVFSRLELTDLIKTLNEKVSEDDDSKKVTAKAEADEAARTICVRVERGLSDLGLNSYDTAAALWAVARSDQFKADAGQRILDTPNCSAAQRWRDHKSDLKPAGET